MDKAKWRGFISTLSTNELEHHSKYILSFAKEYLQMVAEELYAREVRTPPSAGKPASNAPVPAKSHAPPHGNQRSGNGLSKIDLPGTMLDFYAITQIQEAVASYGEEKARKRIAELNAILSNDLTDAERAAAAYEKELCECQLGENDDAEPGQLDEDDVCKLCGAVVRRSTAFCTKCGAKRQP